MRIGRTRQFSWLTTWKNQRLTIILVATAIQNYNTLHSMNPLPNDDMLERNLRLQRCFRPLSKSKRKPFDSHYSFLVNTQPTADPVRNWLRQNLPCSVTYSKEERLAREDEYESAKPALKISTFVDRLARLLAALVGGIFFHCSDAGDGSKTFQDNEFGYYVGCCPAFLYCTGVWVEGK